MGRLRRAGKSGRIIGALVIDRKTCRNWQGKADLHCRSTGQFVRRTDQHQKVVALGLERNSRTGVTGLTIHPLIPTNGV